MQQICETCHYRMICAKGLTEQDPACKYYQDERIFGVFDPAPHQRSGAKM